MAVKKTAKSNQPRLRFTVRHALTDIYVVMLFTFFPLFLSNYYAAARRDKFWSFLIITAVIGVAVGIISLVNLFTRNSEYNRKLNTHRDPFSLSLTDIGFFAFAGVTLISTLASGRIGHCLMGLSGNVSNGRNMGLITILLLLGAYMMISRFFFDKKVVYYCIFGGITIVSVLAILNYYYIDPLGMFEAYKGSSSYDTVINDFTSTIGNKNYLSALICVALPFSFGMAIATEDKIMRIVAYVSTALQFMGLIVATSDGGFLGCFAAFAVMAVVVSRSRKKLMRYCAGIAVMMLGAKVLWLFDLIMKGNSKGYSSFSEFFISNNAVFVILVIFAIFAGILFYDSKRKNEDATDELSKIVFYTILAVVCLAAVGFAGLMIYFTFIDKETALTGMLRFFRFNEYWGTHRGYFWINSFEVYSNMNFWQKLFGAGPETFYYMFQPYFSEMSELFNEGSTNAAHNVYINYLITQGIFGLAAYLMFIGSAVVSSIKNSKLNPLSLVCAFVILAYAVQDIVNIANPVNVPWFIIFIAVNESTRLRANSTYELTSNGF
ncbi:MAG: O-antigen ligase family protein [Ruminococcus sp.]|nr:O-antigen ligase family protein [Ruminococcus sp.]